MQYEKEKEEEKKMKNRRRAPSHKIYHVTPTRDYMRVCKFPTGPRVVVVLVVEVVVLVVVMVLRVDVVVVVTFYLSLVPHFALYLPLQKRRPPYTNSMNTSIYTYTPTPSSVDISY